MQGFELDFGNGGDQLRELTMGPTEARERNVLRPTISDQGVPVLRNMLLAIDGLEYQGKTLNTAEERPAANGKVEQVLVAEPRFYKLPLLPRLMHTVASPPVTYLLLTIGLSLLIFELFTAGVGVAGVVGAGSVVLACYGLGVLPINGWALAALFVAFFGLAIDVQTGVPAGLDGHRAGALRRRVLVPVPGRAAAVVDHVAGRHRRRRPRLHRGHAVDGPGPVRHPDDRAGVDDRRARRHRCRHRPDRRGRRAGRAVAGPHQPGHAHWPRATPCGSSPSTASRSRWSRRRAGPRTTGSGAAAAPTGRERRAATAAPESGDGPVATRRASTLTRRVRGC